MNETRTTTLLPDELDKLKYPPGIDPVSVRATYSNRRQIERHQALLRSTGKRLDQFASIARGNR